MPAASFAQTLFLGGEWSVYAQGRFDADRYKTALNVCLNSYPREEGGWTRRPGTRVLGPTKNGDVARLVPFDLSSEEFYQIEFGDEYARFYRNGSLLYDDPVAVSAFDTSTPVEVTTGAAHGLTSGDQVVFVFAAVDDNAWQASVLRNRQFVVTVTGADTFTIVDAVTGESIDGNDINYSGSNISVALIIENDTAFDDQAFPNMRYIQGEESLVLLEGTVPPQVAHIEDQVPDISAIVFLDGPYLDPVTTVTTLDPSGVSGSVTVVANNTTKINDGTGFQSTDVGRHIRLFWEPAAWSSGSSYAVGDVVTYEGQYYACVKTRSATAITPPRDLQYWTLASTSVSMWTWLKITAVGSTTSVTATVMGDALPDATARSTWRLGLFSDTTGWPTIGTFHKGRLWLAGVQKNRVDASKSNDPYNFEPTTKDGTVADDNAIAAVANAEARHKTVWMRSTDEGLIFGTAGGEWIGRASANDDPISPTNFDVKPVSRYRCADTEPALAGSLLLFVQRAKQKVFEFPLVSEQGKLTATNLSVAFRHRLEVGIEEIIYQNEPTPMVWARRTDGRLVGCVYKRDAEVSYAGWHYNEMGDDRLIDSISVGPSIDNLSDALWMITHDTDENEYHYVEQMTPQFEDSLEDWQAFFVDKGVTPSGAEITSTLAGDVLRLYGLWPLEGQTVAAVIGGLDCGDFEVADGQIDIPLSGDPLTLAFLVSLNDTGYGDFSMKIVEVI